MSQSLIPEDFKLNAIQDGALRARIAQVVDLVAPSVDECIKFQKESMERLPSHEVERVKSLRSAQQVLPQEMLSTLRFMESPCKENQPDNQFYSDSAESIRYQVVTCWIECLEQRRRELQGYAITPVFLGCEIYPMFIQVSGRYIEYADLLAQNLVSLSLDEEAVRSLLEVFSNKVKYYISSLPKKKLVIFDELLPSVFKRNDGNFEVY